MSPNTVIQVYPIFTQVTFAIFKVFAIFTQVSFAIFKVLAILTQVSFAIFKVFAIYTQVTLANFKVFAVFIQVTLTIFTTFSSALASFKFFNISSWKGSKCPAMIPLLSVNTEPFSISFQVFCNSISLSMIGQSFILSKSVSLTSMP